VGLLTGHTNVRGHMFALGLIQCKGCQLCGNEKEDSVHCVTVWHWHVEDSVHCVIVWHWHAEDIVHCSLYGTGMQKIVCIVHCMALVRRR